MPLPAPTPMVRLYKTGKDLNLEETFSDGALGTLTFCELMGHGRQGELTEMDLCRAAYLVRCVNEREGLVRLIRKQDAVIKDFMHNIGRCSLQDYQALNEALCEARAVLAQAEKEGGI